MPDAKPANPQPPEGVSWIDGLADFLMDEEGVEAIRINPEDKRISVATLGTVDATALQRKLSEVLKALDSQWVVGGKAIQPTQYYFACVGVFHTVHRVGHIVN